MTNQQFFFTRKEPISPPKGETEIKFKECRDSFNLSKVIRSIQLDDDRVLILLDDIHQRPQEVPVKNKQGKITAYKREMNIFQSEIYISAEDGERFYKVTAI